MGHGEHVVPYERQSFVRAQRVEDREEREADGVPECHEVFRSRSGVERHGEVWQPVVEGNVRVGAARPQ
ncbi:hypothetical protein, partial [Streptomyces canarius]